MDIPIQFNFNCSLLFERKSELVTLGINCKQKLMYLTIWLMLQQKY